MNAKPITIIVILGLVGLVAADNSLDHLESKLSRAMDSLNSKGDIEIYGNMVTLEKVPVTEVTEEGRSSTDPLVSKIETFLRTRRLQVHLPNDGSAVDMFGRALGQKDVGVELRGLAQGSSEARTKLKKIALPILLALKLKALIVLPIIISLVALISFKGLGAGLLSLLFSGAIALKSLFTPPPPAYPARVSYGIVKPHDVHHEHWHRSQEEVNQPYRGWTPEINGEQYPYQDIP